MQPDFLEQETLLQVYCRKLGAKSDHTPVAHCEVAGEGIEFDWGYSKTVYRSKPLSEKRNKSQFHSLVDSVLSNDVLTLSVCRSNAQRARQYMLAYMTLDKQQRSCHTSFDNTATVEHTQTKQADTKLAVKQELKVTYTLIEKCVDLFRKRRSHRNAIDFDGKYLKDEVLKNVVDGMVLGKHQKIETDSNHEIQE